MTTAQASEVKGFGLRETKAKRGLDAWIIYTVVGVPTGKAFTASRLCKHHRAATVLGRYDDILHISLIYDVL